MKKLLWSNLLAIGLLGIACMSPATVQADCVDECWMESAWGGDYFSCMDRCQDNFVTTYWVDEVLGGQNCQVTYECGRGGCYVSEMMCHDPYVPALDCVAGADGGEEWCTDTHVFEPDCPFENKDLCK
jgi:hypothetical protein